MVVVFAMLLLAVIDIAKCVTVSFKYV